MQLIVAARQVKSAATIVEVSVHHERKLLVETRGILFSRIVNPV
jgi:hypothetical protein